MKRGTDYRGLFVVLAIMAAILMLVSCGPKAVKPMGEMDTPDHHVFTGLKLLDQGQYPQAQGEFDRAIQLATKFSRAFTGTALVKAYQNDFPGALKALDKAWEYANNNEEKLVIHVAYIRVYTMNKAACARIGTDCSQDTSWLDKSTNEFDNAVAINAKYAPAYYFMGLCYKTALNFSKSGEMFAKVLELKAEYTAEADVQWKLVQDIQRAMPGTVTGKKIAPVEKLTRAAALFMEEMKIYVLYKKRTPKEFDTSFKDPDRAKVPGRGAPTATYIAANPPENGYRRDTPAGGAGFGGLSRRGLPSQRVCYPRRLCLDDRRHFDQGYGRQQPGHQVYRFYVDFPRPALRPALFQCRHGSDLPGDYAGQKPLHRRIRTHEYGVRRRSLADYQEIQRRA